MQEMDCCDFGLMQNGLLQWIADIQLTALYVKVGWMVEGGGGGGTPLEFGYFSKRI